MGQRSLHEISSINEKKTVYVRQYNPMSILLQNLSENNSPHLREIYQKSGERNGSKYRMLV